MQGVSLVPAFKSSKAVGHRLLCNEHFGARYVREGEWKMVSKRNEAWQLFNIDDDESETNNLAAVHPNVVQRMDKLWQDWARANHVFPKPKG